MLLTILIVLLVIDAIVLIVSILLQPRSQGGLGAAFGGSGYASTLFGGKGGMEFLTKVTAVLSLIFVALIIAVNVYITSPHSAGGMMDRSTPTQQPLQGPAPEEGE